MTTHRFDEEPLVDAPANGKLIAVVGTPSDGDVVTYVAANNRYEPRPPSGSPAGAIWMPLTTVVAGVPQLVWDANDSLIPTLVP
jgi:hypothetical protein